MGIDLSGGKPISCKEEILDRLFPSTGVDSVIEEKIVEMIVEFQKIYSFTWEKEIPSIREVYSADGIEISPTGIGKIYQISWRPVGRGNNLLKIVEAKQQGIVLPI